jgi:SAM-dependent methyltransferase
MNESVPTYTGIVVPGEAPAHRDEEYDSLTFDLLLRMQRNHFWYRGRHRFLLAALHRADAGARFGGHRRLSAVDIGGGCGGWLEYLHTHAPELFSELALSDSSLRALDLAEPVVGAFASRYHVDLLNLPWRERWDVMFLLDVLEHIPEDGRVLQQLKRCLRPGGLLFVTTPALRVFWTYNDEVLHHQRRYSRGDFERLARHSGLRLRESDYFMFFLSPALYLARAFAKPPRMSTPEAIQAHLGRTHRVPARPLNELLAGIFSLEAVLAAHVQFPWGTSILGVFERPLEH